MGTWWCRSIITKISEEEQHTILLFACFAISILIDVYIYNPQIYLTLRLMLVRSEINSCLGLVVFF